MYNPFSLEHKKILVTGASSGIGRGISIDTSKMGASLIVTARNEFKKHVRKEIKGYYVFFGRERP